MDMTIAYKLKLALRILSSIIFVTSFYYSVTAHSIRLTVNRESRRCTYTRSRLASDASGGREVAIHVTVVRHSGFGPFVATAAALLSSSPASLFRALVVLNDLHTDTVLAERPWLCVW